MQTQDNFSREINFKQEWKSEGVQKGRQGYVN